VDYDWFRMSYRMMDFYFFSRVVSMAGDRTVLVIGSIHDGDRFIIFLEEYHKINPLTANELRFMREAYRFFILNYVIKDGSIFSVSNMQKNYKPKPLTFTCQPQIPI